MKKRNEKKENKIVPESNSNNAVMIDYGQALIMQSQVWGAKQSLPDDLFTLSVKSENNNEKESFDSLNSNL